MAETFRQPWVWNEIEHWTGPDLAETIQLVSEQAEADDFIEAYAEACEDDEHALHNIRYILSVMISADEDELQRIADLFGVDPPIKGEVISPRQWWKDSSCGIKVERNVPA